MNMLSYYSYKSRSPTVESLPMNATKKSESTPSRAERQRQQLRADIIEAAFIEFSERGYHQAAISHIAKRLGIGHGTFYRYFKNKRDILEHVIDDVYEKIKAAMADDNAPTATTSLEEYQLQVGRMGISLTRIIVDTPALFRMALFETTSIDPEMTQRVIGFQKWSAKQVAAYFENGVKLGFLRKDLDIEATSFVLIGMITSTVLLSLNTDDHSMFKRINDAVQRILLDGIVVH